MSGKKILNLLLGQPNKKAARPSPGGESAGNPGPGACRSLSLVAIGGCAVVEKVEGESSLRRRFRDMGLVRGAILKVVRNAPLRDPIEIEIRGCRLAIRRADASFIKVGECEGGD